MIDLKIEYIPIESLRPFEGNPRVISSKGLRKLERSLEEFGGFVKPVICWRNGDAIEIVAGHQILKAAKERRIKRIPVIIYPFEDWRKAYAFNIADNKLQDESGWDFPKLKELFEELDESGIDLDLTGFDPEELADIIGGKLSEGEGTGGGEAKTIQCPQCGFKFKPE
jgi:ParB-like chromosome segregation protein Spo0J